MSEVYQFINVADCLVLPSKHDGWGTVVSEALISGVPAICSDTCGVAEVVKLSNYGGVFKSGNIEDLVNKRFNEKFLYTFKCCMRQLEGNLE